MPAFFDTNVIRYAQRGLLHPLSDELKQRVALSPISAIEVMSQIANNPEEALGAVKAFDRWLQIDSVVLLQWYQCSYADRVFGFEIKDQVAEHLTRAITTCFSVTEAQDDLVDDARALRRFIDDAKVRKARILEEAVRRIRTHGATTQELRVGARQALAFGIAQQIGATPGSWNEEEVADRLNGYFEFHIDLIVSAVNMNGYNFFSPKHLNDHFDAEQLLYLADPNKHFITCDRGYLRVATASQKNQIHVLPARDLVDPSRASGRLTEILQHC